MWAWVWECTRHRQPGAQANMGCWRPASAAGCAAACLCPDSCVSCPPPLPAVHLPQATVQEALAFSATLRLPSTVDQKTRDEFIEEVRR